METKKHYYTAESIMGSSTSHGFSNDTIVRVWESYKARQNYINNYYHKNLSIKPIKRREVTKYAINWDCALNRNLKPRPFTSERWMIAEAIKNYSGQIGVIDIGNENYPGYIDSLN